MPLACTCTAWVEAVGKALCGSPPSQSEQLGPRDTWNCRGQLRAAQGIFTCYLPKVLLGGKEKESPLTSLGLSVPCNFYSVTKE